MHVLHVLPVDIARGAQIFARSLADEAHRRDGSRHTIVVLFRSGPSVLEVVHRLDVPQGLGRKLGADPRASWRLRRLVRRLDPDVVVAHGGESLKYVATAGIRGAPLVAHAIGTMPADALRGLRGRAYERLWSRADVVVAVSSDVARELQDMVGVPDSRMRVIPNGRDTLAFDFLTAVVETEAPPRLTFVGRLVPSKRPDLFLEVVSRLRSRGRDVEAVVVGAGPLATEMAPAADRAGVRMLGERHDVPALLRSSAVFVFTSDPVGEGMPGVLIEAGLCGVPTVTTAVPGAGDVVVDRVTGRVVEPGNVQALTDAVDELLLDPERRCEQGAAARDWCVSRFSLSASVDAWQGLLAEVWKASARSRR